MLCGRASPKILDLSANELPFSVICLVARARNSTKTLINIILHNKHEGMDKKFSPQHSSISNTYIKPSTPRIHICTCAFSPSLSPEFFVFVPVPRMIIITLVHWSGAFAFLVFTISNLQSLWLYWARARVHVISRSRSNNLQLKVQTLTCNEYPKNYIYKKLKTSVASKSA